MQVRHYGSFADLVKALRQSRQLSQRALARLLQVSPGYVGQWELQLSQPSPEVATRLCRAFAIEGAPDVEHVQRLAYASRAPQWLRQSIVNYREAVEPGAGLAPVERRVVDALRKLSDTKQARLAEKIEGWVEAMNEAEP